jgi:hypothetical protein
VTELIPRKREREETVKALEGNSTEAGGSKERYRIPFK